MFLSRFRRRKSTVVERVQAYATERARLEAKYPINVVITPPSAAVDPRKMAAMFKQELDRHRVPSAGERKYTAVMFPTSVEGCLLADQFEHQLKQRGLT